MTVTDIKKQKKDNGKYSVYIDGQYAFSLIAQDIEYFKIKIGNEISQSVYDYIVETVVYIKAQDTALKYLGYKMRTEKEVRKKLEQSDFSNDVIEKVMEFLLKYNYVNDYEYSMAFIRQCLKINPLGSYGICQKLRSYGVKSTTAEKAIADSEIDEYLYAKKLIDKKTSGKIFNSDADLKKLQDFLLRRGFSYDIIKPVIDEYKLNAGQI